MCGSIIRNPLFTQLTFVALNCVLVLILLDVDMNGDGMGYLMAFYDDPTVIVAFILYGFVCCVYFIQVVITLLRSCCVAKHRTGNDDKILDHIIKFHRSLTRQFPLPFWILWLFGTMCVSMLLEFMFMYSAYMHLLLATASIMTIFTLFALPFAIYNVSIALAILHRTIIVQS